MSTINSGTCLPKSQDSNRAYYGDQQEHIDLTTGLPNLQGGFSESAPPSKQNTNSSYGETTATSYVQPSDYYTDPDVYEKICPSETNVKGFTFSDQSIRRGFIRKVYSILMVQLLITTVVVALFIFERSLKTFVEKNVWLMLVSVGIVVGAMIVLACCGEVRRTAPANYFLLGLFTLGMSFLLGVISSVYGRDEVLMAAGITAVLCLALTLFAFQTKFDFTMYGGFLYMFCVVLLIFAIAASAMAATGHNRKILSMVYASLGALLFSLYLVYDTQLMLGGQHKYSVSPEEYVFAALNLYVDIIYIFIYILRLIGGSR